MNYSGICGLFVHDRACIAVCYTLLYILTPRLGTSDMTNFLRFRIYLGIDDSSATV